MAYRDPGTAGVVMRGLVSVEPSDGPLIYPSSSNLDLDDDNDWDQSQTGTGAKDRDNVKFKGTKIDLFQYAPKPVPIPMELLLNKAANVESIVSRQLFRKSERSIEKLLTKGNGAGKGEGFLAAGAGVASVVSQDANLPTWASILNTLYAIPEQWAGGQLTWVCQRLSYPVVLSITDPAGFYIFALAAQAAPNTILGVPVKFNQFMDGPRAAGGFDTNAHPYAVGNWSAAMVMAEAPGAERVTRFDDSNFHPGAGFAITNLVGCKVVEPNAIRLMKIAVS